MWELAAEVGLDLNSPYAYVLWAHHHDATTLVADDPDDPAGGLAGFVLGYRLPADPDVVFVWQIGVSAAARGNRVAGRLLDELIARTGCRYLEATVTPSNHASAALFRGLARRHDTEVVTSELFGEDLFPDGHEPEARFLIGPLSSAAFATTANQPERT